MKKIVCTCLIFIIIITSVFTVYGQQNDSITIESAASEDVSNISPEQETENTTVKQEPETLPAGKFYKGDINNDRLITASDARSVLKFSAQQISLTQRQCILADINDNKVVNAQDARFVLRMAAKLIDNIECKKAKNASDKKILSQYDERVSYNPKLNGFTTNITNGDVFEKIRVLENYCANLKGVVTFYYTDVYNRHFIQFDSSKKYRTQCTIKAPYIKGMLDYMESHNIPLSKQLVLTNDQKWNGHYLSRFESGTIFTIKELMYYTIRYSDNTAYQVLFDYFGNEVLNDNAKKVGVPLRLDDYIFGETSAADMSKLFLDIYSYNGKYKNEFYDDLMNSYTSPLIGLGLPEDVPLIRKSGTGAHVTVGYHDCAIVFADTPFILIIYTSINFDRNLDTLPFKRISENIYSINQSLPKPINE